MPLWPVQQQRVQEQEAKALEPGDYLTDFPSLSATAQRTPSLSATAQRTPSLSATAQRTEGLDYDVFFERGSLMRPVLIARLAALLAAPSLRHDV